MVWRDITAYELNCLKEPIMVDVRSPGEYEKERIIDAVNLPLLSDDERAQVGTVYAKQGEAVARRLALKIIAPKIPDLVDGVASMRQPGKALVVHCWRGGLRSEAVASFLSLSGIDCFRLTGGYKAWRRQMLSDFAQDAYGFVPVIMHGLTGVGKTAILQKLACKGHAVLDLESCANHRGSVFGGMGLGRQPSQKIFDALLWKQMKMLGRQPVFMEAESRKIGQIALPDCVFHKIQTGIKILISADVDVRVRNILHDYSQCVNHDIGQQAASSLMFLKDRLGIKKVEEIQRLLNTNLLGEAVKVLLVDYYDPLYCRQIEHAKPFALEVSANEPDLAVTEICQWLCASV